MCAHPGNQHPEVREHWCFIALPVCDILPVISLVPEALLRAIHAPYPLRVLLPPCAALLQAPHTQNLRYCGHTFCALA